MRICVLLFFHAPALGDPSRPGFPEKRVGKSRTGSFAASSSFWNHCPGPDTFVDLSPGGLSGLEKLRNRRIKDSSTRVEPATEFFF